MKKRVLAIAATAMATMMMATPVLAEDYKIGICNYVDDASLNQIVDNLESRLKEIGDEKGVNFDISYDNCNADANVMEQIIVELCNQKPLMLKELADLLGRTPDGLRNNYLAKLLTKGKVRLKYPNQINHPKQAYIAVE